MKTPKHTRTCSGGSAPLPWRLGERGEGVSGKEGWVSRGSPAASFQGGAQPRQSPQRGLRTALGVCGELAFSFHHVGVSVPPFCCGCWAKVGSTAPAPLSVPPAGQSRLAPVLRTPARWRRPSAYRCSARSASSGVMLTSLCCRVGEKTKHIFFLLAHFFFFLNAFCVSGTLLSKLLLSSHLILNLLGIIPVSVLQVRLKLRLSVNK